MGVSLVHYVLRNGGQGIFVGEEVHVFEYGDILSFGRFLGHVLDKSYGSGG